MSDATLEDTMVGLCDWRGRCTWISGDDVPLKVGEFIWQHLTVDSQEEAKTMLARVVSLRESATIEVDNRRGERIRARLWPLDSPDVAVCVLSMRIPKRLTKLTKRERDCLELLAQGLESRLIATQLDISMSTFHTHMKRAREKLGLKSMEALIGFAARYCYPIGRPLESDAS